MASSALDMLFVRTRLMKSSMPGGSVVGIVAMTSRVCCWRLPVLISAASIESIVDIPTTCSADFALCNAA